MDFFTLLAACIFAVQMAYAATPIHAMQPADQFGNFSDTINSTRASDDSDLKRDTGYSELLSIGYNQGHKVNPWPKRRSLWNVNEGQYTRIPYCFVDARTFQTLGNNFCRIRAGIQLWADALGEPGAHNGHSIAFREPKPATVFCCKSYYYGKMNQPWAPGELNCDWDYGNWPADTLAIHWIDDVKALAPADAQVGYYADGGIKEKGGRHWMRVTSNAPTATIAHELGHVLGMTHEQNRWDRDDHVEFRCLNIAGIDEIIARLRVAEKMDFETARKAICEDWKKAIQYGSPSASFIKGEGGVDPSVKPAGDGPGGFDEKSIMLYSSYARYNKGGEPNLQNAVLVGIKKDADGNKIPGSEYMLETNTKVSRLDAQFVKDWYPWKD